MNDEPDRKATGFSVAHSPESSAITLGGKDTYDNSTRIRVTIDLKATGFSVGRSPESRTKTVAKGYHSNIK